jgi:hypothetical protein
VSLQAKKQEAKEVKEVKEARGTIGFAPDFLSF